MPHTDAFIDRWSNIKFGYTHVLTCTDFCDFWASLKHPCVQDGGDIYRQLYLNNVRLRASECVADYPIYDGTVLWIMPCPLDLEPSGGLLGSNSAHLGLGSQVPTIITLSAEKCTVSSIVLDFLDIAALC